MVSNVPGLKAEIGKLHATATAKLALREYERQAALRNGGFATEVQPVPEQKDVAAAAPPRKGSGTLLA